MSNIYNHRPLQPTAPVQVARGEGPQQLVVRDAYRIPEALEVIRQDFDVISSECTTLKLQRDDYESKVNGQINEINTFRQVLYDIEERNKQQRLQLEAENNQLRAELQAIRQQSGQSTAPPPPSQSQSHPSNSQQQSQPPIGPAPPPSYDPSYYPRGRESTDGLPPDISRDREREKDRERDRDRADRDREREARERSDREPRRKGPSDRTKVEPEHYSSLNSNNGPSAPSSKSVVAPGNNATPLPSAPPPSAPQPVLAPATPNTHPALPPTYVTTNVESINPLSDLDPEQVPNDLKKEGSDWWAIFNPKVPRVLDVSLLLTLTHESVVCCVRFSADGKYLATGCNRTAQIYDTKTGAKTCVLADEDASKTGDLYIRSVCFSPDGKYLATGAEDKQIRIWDIAKKRIRDKFQGHTQEIYSLDFSRDGRLIVSGSGDKTARIWDMETGACKILNIIEPENIDAGVTSVAISPDARFVAAGSLDMLVRIWDVATGHLVERLKGHKDSVYSVAFSPDGRGLVSGSLDKSLKYWDITPLLRASGRPIVALSQNTNTPSNVVPVPGAKKEGGGEKGSACTVAFTGHKDYVLSVAVSPDGAWVVSGSKDRGVQFWNPKDAQTQLMLQGHKNSVISIDLSPAGMLLATGSGDWQARVWSYSTLQPGT